MCYVKNSTFTEYEFAFLLLFFFFFFFFFFESKTGIKC